MKKIAIIWFPGINCENECLAACDATGLSAEIIKSNTADISPYSGYIIPGGWSYEDRIRAGVIASKQEVITGLRKAADEGKPILGICNGCQILAESAIVPGFKKTSEIALAPNINPMVSGYYCSWIRVKCVSKKNVFNRYFSEGEVIEMPVAHGEGRFVTRDTKLIDTLSRNMQIAFTYCDEAGRECAFPFDPNGSMRHIAGITNQKGNVLALMPHPERALFEKQRPGKTMRSSEEAFSLTKASKIFKSMGDYIKNGYR